MMLLNYLIDKYVLFRTRIIYGPKSVDYNLDEFAVFCLVKNGEDHIRSFIEHYQALGAKHIFLLDNNSTDKTIEIAKGFSNTSAYKTLLSFKTLEREMRRSLINFLFKNKWCLCVDIDEFLDFPHSDKISMKHFLRYLKQNHFTAVIGYMLDMFSKNFSSNANDHDPYDLEYIYPYYNIDDISKTDYPLWRKDCSQNRLSDNNIKFYSGGIRKSLFGGPTGYFLTKHPLLYVDRKLKPITHPHFCDNAFLADVTCVLKHYKLIRSFPKKAKTIVEALSYPAPGLEEHKSYVSIFEKKDNFSLYDNNSRRLESVNDLIENDFLYVSQNFESYIRSLCQEYLS